jgi:hypothetical protein
VVDRDRRDAAPVVDARVEQAGEVAVGQVGRRLQVRARAQENARRGDRPQVLVERGLGMACHARAGLGAEVLDDDLLDVAVTIGEPLDREQRLQPLGARLADPDQDPGGERHPLLAGGGNRLQAHGRALVG